MSEPGTIQLTSINLCDQPITLQQETRMSFIKPCCIATALLSVLTSLTPAADVLQTAKRLANNKYSGWTYGSKQSRKQIDCVQFVAAVTEEALKQPLGSRTRKQILISNLSKSEREVLPVLIQDEDKRIKGIQQALVSIRRGTAIKPSNARAGDLVQYWMKKRDGSWFGHSGILETVEKMGGAYRAKIFGAHKSIKGIGSSKFKLHLNGPDRKVFIVRIR